MPRNSTQTKSKGYWNALYFAFGANLNPFGMKSRCPNARINGILMLPGYRLVFRGVADIIHTRNPDDFVPGVLWEVTSECVNALDAFEGYPFLYDRVTIPMELVEGHDVFCYQMNDQSEYGLPNSHYYDCIKEGYEHFFLPTQRLEEARRHAYDWELNEAQREWELG